MRFIWERKDWLAMPPATPEIADLLDNIDEVRREIVKFADRKWFKDVQRDVFLNEILYSWDIEDMHLYGLEEKTAFTDACLGFVQSRSRLAPEDVVGFHDAIFPRMEKGFRKSAVGVGLSMDRLVYMAPPAEDVPRLLERLCQIVNGSRADRHLRAAFMHAAFVLIHPFADGNGRIARMIAQRIAPDFLAATSKSICINRPWYYSELEKISVGGSFDECIEFLLDRRCEAYHETLRNIQNIDVYLNIHGGKFTTIGDMRTKISFDIENEDKYRLF